MSSPYPEHDKMLEVKDRSQSIGFFLDWLAGQGVNLMRYEPVREDALCRSCFGDEEKAKACRNPNCEDGYVYRTKKAWVREPRGIEQLLADYFDIDLQKIAEEKDAMLANIRKVASQ